MTQQHKSIYRRGAEHGVALGVYLSVMFVAMALSLEVAWLGLLAMTMALCVPLLTYKMLRRSYVADMGLTRFSELWMEGIITFAGGSVIMAVAALAYMKWVEPSFIADRVAEVAQFYRDAGQTQFADTLDAAIASHTLPTAAETAVEFVWLGVFSGSMLSMLMSLLVRARKVSGAPGRQ